jgi:hypothetical protein
MGKKRMMGVVTRKKRMKRKGKKRDDQRDDQEGEDEEEDKNNIMEFILQLESVADEDDQSDIQRLWKKELKHVMNMKQMGIEKGDTDDESDEENFDDVDHIKQDKKRIENAIKEFKRNGNTYFESYNKEKVETISKW